MGPTRDGDGQEEEEAGCSLCSAAELGMRWGHLIWSN